MREVSRAGFAFRERILVPLRCRAEETRKVIALVFVLRRDSVLGSWKHEGVTGEDMAGAVTSAGSLFPR
jgi:hypothetical protein